MSILKSHKVNVHSVISTQQESQVLPIGVFDSGVGGLTVLREMQRQLPQEAVLYFGDTARVPYGTRSPGEIITFVREILTWMTQERVKMAVMACNTSSALALEHVRQEFDIPILGLILPGARAAVATGRRIGVIATPATVASDSYRQAMLEVNPKVQVWQVPCPKFVPLIERNQIYHPETIATVHEYLQPLLEAKIDTLVYGCTHYPHLAPVITPLLARSVRQIDPANHVVAAAGRELELLGLRNTQSPTRPRFCVSSCPEQFAEISLQWLGYLPTVEQVELPILSPVTSSLETAG